MTPIPDHLQPHLDRELDEGEPIIWSAQPLYRVLKKNAKRGWYSLGIVLIFFIVLFLLMGWLATITPPRERTDEPWIFFTFAGAFLLIWIASFPCFMLWAKSLANKTIYAITNKRAIILVVNKDGSVSERDYRADELIHLARNENPDNTGTLTFESARGAGATSQSATRHKFHAIENVLEVERLLRKQFGDA